MNYEGNVKIPMEGTCVCLNNVCHWFINFIMVINLYILDNNLDIVTWIHCLLFMYSVYAKCRISFYKTMVTTDSIKIDTEI